MRDTHTMINPFNSGFLSPTKEFRRLSLLLVINDFPESSQHTIGRTTHLSSSMVNNYIKKFKQENLITVAGETNRTQSYHLTPLGRDTLMKSLLLYSAEIVQLYSAVKREISKILLGFFKEGIRSVALFGAAETAEVVYAAIKDTPLKVIGLVDSDAMKHGKPFNGLIIQPPEKLLQINPDAVVITSFAKQEAIYNSIRKIIGEKKIKVKKLSGL